ncbi:MAG: aldehyde dehydrogenase family protein [Candidatus Hydrogenedentes bacterium]|nr:aldehyde dehydrogenase family protein [Candidatus Hydrogenedentota bacterium]
MPEATLAPGGLCMTTQTAPPPDVVVRDPRSQQVLYSFTEPTDAEVVAAFARARAAFEKVRKMPVADRVRETLKLRAYILQHKEKIVDRIVQETGKSRVDALMADVAQVLSIIEFYSRTAEKHLADEKVPTPLILQGKKSYIHYEPMGVALIVSPWNFPFNLAFVPMITAFVAGNAIVFKPSEWTPLKGLVEEIIDGSGFMKDAITVIYGGKDTGRKLIDQRPAKILFTGSTRAGKQIMEQAAQYLIPVELELGGKDPMVVFDDVDIERAAAGAMWGGLMNCGQTCTSIERVLVHERIHDSFVKALAAKIEKLSHAAERGGQPDAGDLDVGHMTAPFQVKKVEELVDDARAKGATIHTGGRREGDSHAYPPTLISGVNNTMRVITEETFGPVITVEKFKTEDEAVRMANDTPYGLSAAVWSNDLARAERVARNIESGNVSINNVLATQGNAALPFGGTKESGFGRYFGPHGLHSFSHIKSVIVDGGGKIEPHWFPYSKEKYALLSGLLDVLHGKTGLAKMLGLMSIDGKLRALTKKGRAN